MGAESGHTNRSRRRSPAVTKHDGDIIAHTVLDLVTVLVTVLVKDRPIGDCEGCALCERYRR